MKTLLKLYYKWLAKRRLIHRYTYLNEVNAILEAYVTRRILDGGSQDYLNKSRNDLISKQNEIREQEKLIEFIRRMK